MADAIKNARDIAKDDAVAAVVVVAVVGVRASRPMLTMATTSVRRNHQITVQALAEADAQGDKAHCVPCFIITVH